MKLDDEKLHIAYKVFCKRTGGRLIVCRDRSIGALTKNGWRWLFDGKHSFNCLMVSDQAAMNCLMVSGQAMNCMTREEEETIIAKAILDAAKTNDVVSKTGTYELWSNIASKGETLETLLIENDLNAS